MAGPVEGAICCIDRNSLLLSEFKQDGMIDVQEREITILNHKTLLETARLDV